MSNLSDDKNIAIHQIVIARVGMPQSDRGVDAKPPKKTDR
jgi:hypothetical protein